MVDQDDDEVDAYEEVVRTWRSFYFGLSAFATRLSLFCAYHDRASHERLKIMLSTGGGLAHDPTVLEPISLTPIVHASNGLSTISVLPQLRDARKQSQIGEFGAVLAIGLGTSYSKPWVGFTTASEPRKALWREVRLDLNGRLTLLWPPGDSTAYLYLCRSLPITSLASLRFSAHSLHLPHYLSLPHRLIGSCHSARESPSTGRRPTRRC